MNCRIGESNKSSHSWECRFEDKFKFEKASFIREFTLELNFLRRNLSGTRENSGTHKNNSGDHSWKWVID